MKKIKIITVEDNEIFAKILEISLREELNIEIKNFSSGEECIANLNWNPDLIILDYKLSGMNGLETLRKIKKAKSECKVIVITSQFDSEVEKEFMREGAIFYIEKHNNPMGKLLKYIEELQFPKGK